MKLVEYPDAEMMMMDLADTLASELKNCLLVHEHASFAVPGGTTPGPIFDSLCAVDLDWSRVHVMLTDERWVPEDHPRSNAALVKSRLLTGRAAAARFISFYREGMTAAQAAPVLSEELKVEMPLSLLLLGMGEDMHTASLFPGAPGTAAAMAPDAPILCAVSPEDQPEERLTFSAPALNGAMDKHLVIFGDAKRAAFEGSARMPPAQAPVRAVMEGGIVHWAA